MKTHEPGECRALMVVYAMLGAFLATLIGACVIQLATGELPCPLCMLQRMAMSLCALGLAYVLFELPRASVAPEIVFARGFGVTLVSALLGAGVAARQVLLHIMPGDRGYGGTVWHIHLYTWSLIVFLASVLGAVAGLFLLGARRTRWTSSRAVGSFLLWTLALVLVVQMGLSFMEEGFHWVLPDNPARYLLFN